ncbi:hypothetical protein ACVWXO_006447 [Bradyrhizobium sp. LM2.7]
MTARAPIGALRHRLSELQAVPSPAPPPHRPISSLPSAQTGNSANARLKARLTGLAFRLHGFLSARRRQLLPLTTRAAALIDRKLIAGPAGATLLWFTNRQIARRSRLGSFATRLIQITLASAAQVHLAASRKPSALRVVRLLNLVFRGQVRQPARTCAIGLFHHTGAMHRLRSNRARSAPTRADRQFRYQFCRRRRTHVSRQPSGGAVFPCRGLSFGRQERTP